MSPLILLIAPAFAAQASLELDASEVQAGQTVELRLVVSEAEARGYPKINAPDGLVVTYQGQAQQRTVINFKMSYSTIYTYALVAMREGSYTLGPVTVDSGAGVLTTSPLTVTVVPRSAASSETLTATVPETAWVGQTVLYALRFATPRQLIKGRWGFPESDGFVAEPNVEPVTTDYTVEDGGTTLSVQELTYALRATRPGPTTLAGGLLQAQFPVQRRRRSGGAVDPSIILFTDTSNEVFAADPKKVEVKPLPPGAPAGFGGLVGNFSVELRASGTEVRVGDTVTLEMRVQGDGSLFDLKLPPLEGEGFRVYDDQPVATSEILRGRFRASAVFKRAVVTERPGTIDVPAVEIPYFNPTSGRYEVATSTPISLVVSGEARVADLKTFGPTVPAGVNTTGEDILPVRTASVPARPISAGYAGILLVPGAALLGAELLGRLRQRRAPATGPVRVDLENLPDDAEQRAALVERAFREEVGERLGVAPDALRREHLVGLGADAEEAEEIYRSLESARYGGVGSLPEARVRAFVRRRSG